MNSKQKGKRGELEFCKLLNAAFPDANARRGQQYCGASGDPDVVSDLFPWIHWEVKRVEALNLSTAIGQATRDLGANPDHKMLVVVHKKNRGQWLATLKWDDFVSVLAQCPHCPTRGGSAGRSRRRTKRPHRGIS